MILLNTLILKKLHLCYGVAVDLGNIFEGEIHFLEKAEPCTADICPCPYYGLKCAEGTPKIIGSNNEVLNWDSFNRTY